MTSFFKQRARIGLMLDSPTPICLATSALDRRIPRRFVTSAAGEQKFRIRAFDCQSLEANVRSFYYFQNWRRSSHSFFALLKVLRKTILHWFLLQSLFQLFVYNLIAHFQHNRVKFDSKFTFLIIKTAGCSTPARVNLPVPHHLF